MFIATSADRERPGHMLGELPSAWTDWGKWLALITMTIDHLVRYVVPDAWSLGWASETFGRVAFPLFAAMVAWHALFDTRDPWRYARRILVIGLLAQLPYMLMPRLLDTLVFNVCFTLSFGLMWGSALWALIMRPPTSWPGHVTAALGMAASLLAWYWGAGVLEYDHQGVLLVPVFMLTLAICAYARGAQRVLIVPAVVLLALVARPLNFVSISQWVTLTTCAVVVLLALGLARRVPRLPGALRMPRWLWLSWYPGHLTLIAVWVYAPL